MYEKFSKEGYYRVLPQGAGVLKQFYLVLTFGCLGRVAPVDRRKWKIDVFLKENIGFSRSRVLPSGSREGGLGVPGTSFGRRRAPSVCSEDDFGPSGDDLGQL